MICADLEHDLDPYVDREVPPETAAAIREHLGACDACRRRVADREALGRMVRSVPYSEAPVRLRSRVAGQAQRTRSVRRLLTWAAAAVLVVSFGGALSLVRSSAMRDETRIDQVVDGHLRSLMADHLFDVQSTDQHTVKPWFLGRLNFSPPVVDLASAGFPLVGGRLDYLDGRPVAALVYQRQKHTINVFVAPEAGRGSSSNEVRTLRGFHVCRGTRDGMSFWAVSDLNATELTGFCRALQTP